MNNDEMNYAQLILTFTRDLMGVQNSKQCYRSIKIVMKDNDIEHYFSKEEVKKIINSTGAIEIDFKKSLYEYEKFLDDFIQGTTKEVKFPYYVDWIKDQGFKIILNKGDITLRGKNI
jgi:hypothetical protein